jgi:hypothetical protein
MKWSQGLIFASIFSYVSAVIMTLLGFPPLSGLSISIQVIYYVGAIIVLSLSPKYRLLRVFCAICYGIAAMMSFSGIQTWTNYDGNLALGPYMAVWDLALAVAMLDDIELPYFNK